MNHNKPEAVPDEAIIACEICLAEIPASEATSDEASDYVAHFCGLECYQLWQRKKAQQKGE